MRQDEYNRPDRESDRIKSEIDCTRSKLDERIDAIQDRLSVHNLAGGLMNSLTDGAGVGSRRAIEGIRNNPVPAALVGLAIAWLIGEKFAGRREAGGGVMRGEHGDREWLSPGAEYTPGRGAHSGPGMGERMGHAGDTLKQGAKQAGEWMRGAGEHISSAVSGVSSAVSSVGGTAADLGRRARESAAAAGEQISHMAGQARRGIVNTYDENPLILGVAAFALGLVGGLAVPTTRAENRLMGRTSRDLKRRAMEAGEKAVQAGQQIATRVADAAKDAAKTDTGDGLGGRLANVIEAAAGVAAEEAREHTGAGGNSKDRSDQGQGDEVNEGQARRQGGPQTPPM